MENFLSNVDNIRQSSNTSRCFVLGGVVNCEQFYTNCTMHNL